MTNIMNQFDDQFDISFWKTTTKPDIYKLTVNESNQLVNIVRLWNGN